MTRFVLALACLASPSFAGPPTDAHGDPLPDGAAVRFGTVRDRIGSVRTRHSFALSPDGKTLAVEDGDGIALWDVDTGRVARRLPRRDWQGDFPNALAFSPDSKSLARLAGRVVAVWDLTTGKEVFEGDYKKEGKFQGIAFVPGADQIVVTSERDPKAFILDRKTGRVLAERPTTEPVQWLSASGRYYLGLGKSVLRVIDAATGMVRCEIEDLEGTFDSPPVLSPDDRRVYLADRTGRLRVFDAANGEQLENLDAPAEWDDSGWSVYFTLSPDGTVAYLTKHGRPTRRRNLKAGKWLDPLPVSLGGPVLSLPSRDRALLVGDDGVLHRYDLKTLKELPAADGFEGSVFAYPSPDGRRVVIDSGSAPGHSRLDLFDLTGKPVWSLRPPAGEWGTPHWSPDGKWLACVGNDWVIVREPGTGKAVRTLRPARDGQELAGGAFFTTAPARLIALTRPDELLLVFDLSTGNKATFDWKEVRGVRALSPDGRTLVQSHDGPGVRLIDPANGKEAVGWTDPPDRQGGHFSGPAFSPDGSYVLSWDLEPEREDWRSRDLMAVVRDPVTLARRRSFKLGFNSIFSFDLSPDGQWLAVGDYSGTLKMWDVASGQRVGTWEGHRDYVSSLSFVGPGKVLTASGDLTALLWDLNPKEKPTKPLWEALAGTDAVEAFRAVWALAADPKGPELLRAKVTVPAAPPADKVRQWIADLGADQFTVRKTATKRLRDLGRLAEPALRAARAKASGEEERSRLDALLAKIPRERTAAEVVQARAVQALELAGTGEARKLLGEWAAGPAGARLTHDAKGALGRITGTRP